MASLLIRSIRYLVTCDDKDQLLEDVDLYCEDGFILSRSGEHPPPPVSGVLPQPPTGAEYGAVRLAQDPL